MRCRCPLLDTAGAEARQAFMPGGPRCSVATTLSPYVGPNEVGKVIEMPPAFAIEHVQASAAEGEIRMRGRLTFADAALLWGELRRVEGGATRGQTLNFEMSAVQRIDGGAMALLACLRSELHRRGVKSEFLAADTRVQQIVHL